jgi:uncharacterized membrane protein YqjE
MSDFGSRLGGILSSIEQLGSMVAGNVETRLQRLRAAVRTEVQRAASALALAIVAAAFTFAALAFGAVAILIAAWDTYPVLAAALIALGFAIIAIVAVLMMRRCSR